jgi:hypothetical protein
MDKQEAEQAEQLLTFIVDPMEIIIENIDSINYKQGEKVAVILTQAINGYLSSFNSLKDAHLTGQAVPAKLSEQFIEDVYNFIIKHKFSKVLEHIENNSENHENN